MNTAYKPRVPDLMEAIFDIFYLGFDLVAAVLFFIFSKGKFLFILYGILTLVLCIGDAFHLVPRVIKALKGPSKKLKRQMGRGLQISSITMTIFYVLLLYIWRETFPELHAPILLVLMIWVSAIIRILICLLPQNKWLSSKGNPRLSLIRNGVFLFTGLGIIILYLISGNTNDYHLYKMAIAIVISFGCYIPVTLFSKKNPKIGMLMIPKTIAYMWMIVMGLQLLFFH